VTQEIWDCLGTKRVEAIGDAMIALFHMHHNFGRVHPARGPEFIDRRRQLNQSPSGSFAQNTEEPVDPQATIGANTSRCLLVEQDDVSLYGSCSNQL
jgi:hypothetical protein